MIVKVVSLIVIMWIASTNTSNGTIWGFYAHKAINKIAVFTLPQEMVGFYKRHINYITENAVNADKRRYAVKEEAPRHYIDIDIYGDSAVYKLPRYWNEAVERYTEDTLQAYGIVPWHINFMHYQLTDAMRVKDVSAILRLSADLGHYIADANVPLHTTANYNGQLTGQRGIHGFWESRLPELYMDSYDLLTGKAEYLQNVQLALWDAVTQAHLALDSVLYFEKELSEKSKTDKKYTYEQRGQSTVKTYSKNYAHAYHKKLDHMVERQLKVSIKMIGDVWYTCWVNAGQPNLEGLIDHELSQEVLTQRKKELEEWKKEIYYSRDHEH